MVGRVVTKIEKEEERTEEEVEKARLVGRMVTRMKKEERGVEAMNK